MSTRVIFNEITAGGTSQDLLITKEEIPATICASGLQGSETIVINQKVNGNYQAVVEDNVSIVLDTAHTNQVVHSPCVLQLVCPSTAGAVSVVYYDKYVD